MGLELVPTMEKEPGCCVACGGTPTAEGQPLPAIDLNVDVDWGSNAYICIECANLIADLIDRCDYESHEALRDDFNDLAEGHKKLVDRYKRLRARFEKLVEGDKVRKAAKARRKVKG